MMTEESREVHKTIFQPWSRWDCIPSKALRSDACDIFLYYFPQLLQSAVIQSNIFKALTISGTPARIVPGAYNYSHTTHSSSFGPNGVPNFKVHTYFKSFGFQLEFAIRMVKVLHMDFSELSSNGTLPNHFSDFDEQKFLLIPNFQKCSVFLDTNRGFEDKYKPRPNQIVVHNLQIDRVEVRRRNEFLMQLPIEVPCQGLISSVIHYQKCLGDIQDIVGGQMAMKSYQLVHLKSITEMQEDEDGLGGVYTTVLDEPYSPGNGEMLPQIATVRREAHTTSSDQSAENASLNGDQIAKQESSITLPQILEYVQSPDQQMARQYFAGRDRQNYTTTDRDLYARLKTDRGLKEFHTLLHTFISDQVTKSKQHLQSSKSRSNFTRLSSKPGPLGFSKPILKQTQCGTSIDSDKLKDPIDANYFKSVTSSVQKKREEHLKKTLEWANKGYSQGGYDSYDEDRPQVQQQADEDVDMVDASEDAEPAFFRRASFVSGGAANGGDKPFARVSNDFSFMKKRVRVNAVDRHVKESNKFKQLPKISIKSKIQIGKSNKFALRQKISPVSSGKSTTEKSSSGKNSVLSKISSGKNSVVSKISSGKNSTTSKPSSGKSSARKSATKKNCNQGKNSSKKIEYPLDQEERDAKKQKGKKKY